MNADLETGDHDASGMKGGVPGHWKPIVMLLAVTPFLTELLSNNVPPSAFFNPLIFLFLATIGYGFPVLLLREFACSRGIGIAGMLCLGLVYGIVNEGILAKTFFLATNVPIGTFDGYGRSWGIGIPWAITISVWHAFHSLLYPILVTYYFFPTYRRERWLTRRGTAWLLAITVILSTAIFFTHSKDHPAGRLSHFIFLASCMGMLMWISARVATWARIDGGGSPGLKPALCGAGAPLVLLLVPVILSGAKIPAVLFEGYFAVAMLLIFWWLAKRPTVPITTCLLFGTGDDIVLGVLSLLGAVHAGSVEKISADVILLLVFAGFLRNLRRQLGTRPENQDHL